MLYKKVSYQCLARAGGVVDPVQLFISFSLITMQNGCMS